MANHSDPSFSDFPEDVQLCILSFLTPEEISTFACTSKQFGSLCRNDSSRLWYSMCDRKWSFKTQINKWGDGKIGFNKLYEKLSEYENLIGFWRRSGGISGEGGISGDAPLVFFEWGDSCVIGSRVTPCKDGSYNVIKSPFIWMSLSSDGQPLNYLENAPQKDSNPSMDMIQVNVNFMGKGFVVLEESIWNCGKSGNSPDANGNGIKNFDNVVMGSSEMEIGSPPDQIMSDMYQHYANRRSPGAGGVRAWRRQRRREKERQLRRTMEPEYLVKLECSPTRTRPLQGLWKGICDDTSLDFYQVVYDDLGGVVCVRVRDFVNSSSGFTPLFWTQNATFIESPLSPEEDYVYNTRVHIRPIAETEYDSSENAPSRIMHVNSRWNVGGRIWQYVDGTFGFDFFSNNFIVDMKHIARDGLILDTAELCSS